MNSKNQKLVALIELMTEIMVQYPDGVSVVETCLGVVKETVEALDLNG